MNDSTPLNNGGFNDQNRKPKQRFNDNLKGLMDGWGSDGQGPSSTEDPSVRDAPSAVDADRKANQERARTQSDQIDLDAARRRQSEGK